MTRIKAVNPQENYRLEIMLENGNSLNLDMKSRLHTLRFGLLRDTEFFNRAETNGVVISWDNKVELSASEVFDLIKKNYPNI